MRKLSLALVLATASAAAILATPADAKARHPAASSTQVQTPAPAATDPASDPTGVYRNGRLIGRDPDAAVRLQIQQYYGRGGAA